MKSQKHHKQPANTVKNTLILTVGLPRSGKSTWARKQNLPVVCPDSIRLALHGQRFQTLAEPLVWAIAHIMVHALFLAGHTTVILDATNITKSRRDEWKISAWTTRFALITTPLSVCLSRAITENDTYIIPIIERMAIQSEPLTSDEFRHATIMCGQREKTISS